MYELGCTLRRRRYLGYNWWLVCGAIEVTIYEDHLVAFIDILGFRDAIGDEHRAANFLKMLKALAEYNDNFELEFKPAANGRDRSTAITPAVTAFSDNIVISYPVKAFEDWKHFNGWEFRVSLMIAAMRGPIGRIAKYAFQNRFLIRGGIAYGPLHHSDGIVLGPAFLEAYDTERCRAVHPRVVFGPSIKNAKGYEVWEPVLEKHDDGMTALSFLTDFLHIGRDEATQDAPDVRARISEIQRVIDAERATLAAQNKTAALGKWDWFKAYFESKVPKDKLALDAFDWHTFGGRPS
jgi:hypothetical protein